MTNICFIITGLQYWTTSYSLSVLHADKNVIYLLFSGVAITGPPLGAITCGLITTKYLGGYTSKKAIYFCFFVFLLMIAFAIPTPFVDNVYAVMALIWLLLFFGGGIEPNLTGIILNTVNAIERPTASSFAIFFYNLFGYLPAPYFYGLVADWSKELDSEGNNISRMPMKVLLFSSVAGGISILIAILLKRHSQASDFKRL